MQIRHHLTDGLLMAYSAGTLPEAFDLAVATHVSLCDECRARLASFDAVGGEVVEHEAPVEMAQDSFEATMARIMDDPADDAPVPARAAPGGIFPAPLRDFVGGDLDAVQWRRVGGGVSQAILTDRDGATARLLRIPGGASVPDHGHKGMELTLVLKGAYRDAEDWFGPGDIEVATEELEHQPVAEPGPDCICLAATDAKLRFNAILPKLAQPFLRI